MKFKEYLEEKYSGDIELFCPKCKTSIKTNIENSKAKCPKCGKQYTKVKIANVK